MSLRSIPLTTAMFMALASTVVIAPAFAHGGGGGLGGGGSFHSAGSGNFAHSKTVTAPVELATRHTLTGQVPAPTYTGSIALNAKGQNIPASAFPPANPPLVGPAPTVLKPVGPGVKVNKGAPAPWLWVPAVPY